MCYPELYLAFPSQLVYYKIPYPFHTHTYVYTYTNTLKDLSLSSQPLILILSNLVLVFDYEQSLWCSRFEMIIFSESNNSYKMLVFMTITNES